MRTRVREEDDERVEEEEADEDEDEDDEAAALPVEVESARWAESGTVEVAVVASAPDDPTAAPVVASEATTAVESDVALSWAAASVDAVSATRLDAPATVAAARPVSIRRRPVDTLRGRGRFASMPASWAPILREW